MKDKTKDTAESAISIMEWLYAHWGKVYFVWDMISDVLLGKPSNTSSGTPPEDLKGGLLRSGDEIKLSRLWTKLSYAEKKLLVDLLEHEFGNLRNPRHFIVMIWAFRCNNKWRTIVTDMDQPAQKIGSDVFTKPEPKEDSKQEGQNKSTRKITKDVYSESTEYSFIFLKKIIGIVKTEAKKTEGTDEEKLEAGYTEAWRQMKALGLPTMPSRENLAWIDENLRLPEMSGFYRQMAESNTVTNINNRIQREATAVQARKQQRGPIANWFRSIL